MGLKQGVFWVAWDSNEEVWTAEIDGQSVRGGLPNVTKKLDERRWEIISVVPGTWTTHNAISGFPPVINGSASSLGALVIFAKKIAS